MIDIMAIENLYFEKSLSEEPIYQIKFKNNSKPMIIEESDYYQLLSMIETIEM